jgi:hypothetical protein
MAIAPGISRQHCFAILRLRYENETLLAKDSEVGYISSNGSA